jgi:hypothetical protein
MDDLAKSHALLISYVMSWVISGQWGGRFGQRLGVWELMTALGPEEDVQEQSIQVKELPLSHRSGHPGRDMVISQLERNE